MDPLVKLTVFAGYVGVPLLVLILSFFAMSRIARWLLRITAVVSLVLFGLVRLAELDCVRAEFTFLSCNRMPDAFGDMMGSLQILFVVSYVTAGPVILLVSAGFELWARQRQKDK